MSDWRQYVSSSALVMWDTLCEALFCYLASQFPDDLISLIESGELGPQDLTYALEQLGKLGTSDRIRDLLIAGMKNQYATVREGSLLGFLPHMRQGDLPLFEYLICEDPSPAVRETAVEVLLDFRESISNRDV